MPTFNEIERSEEGGSPSLLILISVGSTQFRYTDRENDLTALGNLWKAVPSKVSRIKANVMLQSEDVTVSLPRSEAVTSQFFPDMTRSPVLVEIRQTHENASDAPLVFSGSAIAAALDEERTSVVITAKNGLYQINKVGSRRKWQTGCPFVVYGAKCRALAASSAFAGSFSRLSSTRFRFTPDELSSVTDDDNATSYYIRDLFYAKVKPFTYTIGDKSVLNFFIGSKVEIGASTFVSAIYEVPSGITPLPVFTFSEAAELTLFRSIVTAGSSVRASVIPDCTRTIDCCRGIHGNNLNFGGTPTMPYESPVGVSYVGDR